jgi:MFS family permease
MVAGGLIMAAMPHVDGRWLPIALLTIGPGLCSSIYVVCPLMIAEFTPVAQRGAVIAIYGALYTLAGIAAPYVMGTAVQNAVTPLDGYMLGFSINAVILIISGLLGLLLLWPNTERARLLAHQGAAPEFA